MIYILLGVILGFLFTIILILRLLSNRLDVLDNIYKLSLSGLHDIQIIAKILKVEEKGTHEYLSTMQAPKEPNPFA